MAYICSMHTVAALLSDAVKTGQAALVYCEPETVDFTSKAVKSAELVVCCQGGGELRIDLAHANMHSLHSLLAMSVFAAGRKAFCWNAKSLFSHALYCTGKEFKPEAAIIDLKAIEAYQGVRKARPNSFAEALVRIRGVFGAGWEAVQPVYRRIHLPLITKVIPALEAGGLLDLREQAKVHAHYEIEGQENGRLRCSKSLIHSYNPHSIKPDDRQALLPPSPDQFFMCFDFKNMEVAVLQWLSKDENLAEMLQTPDFYTALYKAITGNEGGRDAAKMFFLPHIYGQSAGALSERLGVSTETAEKIAYRIDQSFATAVAWVNQFQVEAASTRWARDNFGRRRYFEDREHRARNFSVQSPAALICLDKLISLHRDLSGIAPVAFHVHDGYAVLATKKNWRTVYTVAKKTLEAESDLAPGLHLKVKCEAGRTLDSLKPIGVA